MQRGLVLQQQHCSCWRRGGWQLQPPARLQWRLQQECGNSLVPQQQQQHEPHGKQRGGVPQAAAPAAAAAAGGLVLPQLLPASGPWGAWAGLIAAGAFGLWAEKHTKLGQRLSGALVATLAGAGRQLLA